MDNKRWQYVFFILPFLYIFLSYSVLSRLVGFYITMPDPVYAYLMNGTNIASGYMHVGHVDHPGTPVQCFAAIVIFIKYLLTGNHTQPLYQDVLLNPESYLYTCSITLIILMGLITYLTATYVYRNTRSILTSLFFQLTPVIGSSVDTYILRPEAFIIITATFFTAYLYVNVLAYEQSAGKIWSKKQVITMGAFSAFLIACKITCIPFILPAFFILREKKWKTIYVAALICSFFIFIIPALSRVGYMYDWVVGLITHDGHYGQGNQRIIDAQEFTKNIGEIFTSNYVFTSLYVIIILACIIAVITRKKSDTLFPLFITGIWLSISALVIMVAKHYSGHYIIPALTFLPLGAIVSYRIISVHQKFINKKAVKYILSSVFASVLIFQTIENVYRTTKHKNALLETQKFLNTYKKMPVIIGCEYDSPFIEPSLCFGIVYSGNLRHRYYQFSNEKYPDSYFYNIDQKKLSKWNVNVMPEEIFEKSNEILFYFRSEPAQSEKKIVDNLFPDMLTDSKRIFINTESHESLYLLTADTSKIKNMLSYSYRVISDLEKVTGDNAQFLSSDPDITLAGASRLSTGEHFSGKNSIKLNWVNQYGLDMNIAVHPGDFIDVTVWRKAGDKRGAIVLQSVTDKNLFYTGGESVIKTGENGWEQIQCRSKIPDNFPEKFIKCYLYYSGNTDAYFDDIQLSIYTRYSL